MTPVAPDAPTLSDLELETIVTPKSPVISTPRLTRSSLNPEREPKKWVNF